MRDAIVFIDTEFTALVDPHLISAAFVSFDGPECYIELASGADTWRHDQCTRFVHTVVLPLLNDKALTLDEARARLAAFIAEVTRDKDRLIFVSDYLGDWLIVHPLIDFAAAGVPIEARLFSSQTVERYDFRGWRHHALVDARALRWAFGTDVDPVRWARG